MKVLKYLGNKMFNYIYPERKEKLTGMDLNQIMNLENDYEFIMALYLKFNEGKKMNHISNENLDKYEFLGDRYKKYIISRIHKVEDISNPTTVLTSITTGLFALYSLIGGITNIPFLQVLLQVGLVFLLIYAYQADKSYKVKCTFLINLLKE